MNFSPDLIAVQGAITSIGNTVNLSKLQNRGGNEKKIKKIVDEIFQLLIDLNYVTNAGPVREHFDNLRKVAIYIVLNSDLTALGEMTSVEGIETVVCTVPTIPASLMCEMLWSLHMETFVYEMCKYLWPTLAIQLAENFITSIKYCSPTECVQKVKKLALACYQHICRLQFFTLESTLKNILSSAFDNFQVNLNYFTNPPNCEKLNSLSKDKQYKYMGDRFHAMLELILLCFEQFSTKQQYDSADFKEIYECSYINHNKQILDFNICDTPNIDLKKCLIKCNMALLDKCQELVMDISVEIFCAWSEFVENDESMQQLIGEACYKVQNKLQNTNEFSKHSLIGMLQPLSRKPESIDDVIKKTNFDELINKIENSNEDKIIWLRALMDKEGLFDNYTAMKYIEKNLRLLSEVDCYKLFKKCLDHLNNVRATLAQNYNTCFIMSIKAFRYCSKTVKLELAKEYFISNSFENYTIDEYESMVTEVFNKLVSAPDGDVTDVLNVFIQNPNNVYTKIFEVAAENVQQTSIMLKVMNLLSCFSEYYYESDVEPCLIKVIKTACKTKYETENLKINLINFINGLKVNNIVPGNKILLLIIMPTLHIALLDKDIECINSQVRLLSIMYSVEELLQYRAPTMAMLAQVMNLVRWRINSFTRSKYLQISPSTLQVTIDVQKALMDSYGELIPDKDSDWLKSRLSSWLDDPLNQYYFRKLWNPPGSNFIEVISGSQINEATNSDSLSRWLSWILQSCTQEEWLMVWDSLIALGDKKALYIIHKAVCLIMKSSPTKQDDTVWPCIVYSHNNYIHIIRYKYLREPLSDDQVATVVDHVTDIANTTSSYWIAEITSIYTPLLAYLAEKKSDLTLNVYELFLSKLLEHQVEFLDAVKRIFSA